MTTLKMSLDDRWAVIGATGSGKTTFDQALVNTYGNQALKAGKPIPIYIIDSKQTGDFDAYTRAGVGQLAYGDEPPKPLRTFKNGLFTVWQPEDDDILLYDTFFHMIYKERRPCVILIDELSSICNSNATRYPAYYDKLLRQGRSMHICMISNTQSPSYIPANLIRQTTHLLRFTLNDEYDTKKLDAQFGKQYGKAKDGTIWNPPDRFGFIYRNLSRPRTVNPTIYYRDMQQMFRG